MVNRNNNQSSIVQLSPSRNKNVIPIGQDDYPTNTKNTRGSEATPSPERGVDNAKSKEQLMTAKLAAYCESEKSLMKLRKGSNGLRNTMAASTEGIYPLGYPSSTNESRTKSRGI